MATESEIARLRRVTDLAANDAVYTDELLSALIDELGFEATAASIWKEKAASFAGLVDTTESGSSRSLSQLYKNALEMSGTVGPAEEAVTSGGSFTVEIERL